MTEAVIDFLAPLGKEFILVLISMIPFIELRGAVIAGINLFHMNPIFVFMVTVVANCIPVPFVIFFIKKIMNLLRRLKKFDKFVTKLETIADSKAGKITRYKYEMLGLCLFVGIPLPGTGAYSGALIAALLGFRKKHSIAAICLGVALAGLIMTLACTTFKSVIGWLA